jgi:predicted RNase H-like HicB family nuclease
MSIKTYTYVVEKCPDTRFYVGYVPGFPGAHSQAETLDESQHNMQKVMEMLLEDSCQSWRLSLSGLKM